MAGSRIDAAMKLVHVHRKLGGRLIQDKYPSHYMPGVGRQVAGAYATKGFVDEAREENPAETIYDPMGNVAMPGTAAPSDEKEPARGSRILEGFSKGFGHGPLGFSEENKLKYPLTTGTWQPFVAPVDALLRLPGGIAGAAAGAVGAGTEAATGDEGFANRAERQARDFADFLMIEAGQVRPRAPTHTDSIPRGGDILPRETAPRPAIERAGPTMIEGEVVGGAPKALPEPPRAMLEAPKEPMEPVRAVEPSPEPVQPVQPVQPVLEPAPTSPITVYHGGADVPTGSLSNLTFYTPDRVAAETYARENFGERGRIHEIQIDPKKVAPDQEVSNAAKQVGIWNEYENPHQYLTPEVYGEDAMKVAEILRGQGYDAAKMLDMPIGGGEPIESYVILSKAPTEILAEPSSPAPMTRSEANQKIKELRQSMAGLEKDSPEFKAIQEQMKEINLQVKSAPQEPSVVAPAPMKEVVPAREAPPRNISPLGLYSHGVESAHLLPMDKGTPQQIKAALETKFAVKPTELEGFDEAFAGKNVVTREEVVKFFEDNRPQIEEVQFGGKGIGDPYEEMHNAAQRIGEDEDTFYRAVRGYDTPSFTEFRDAEQRANWFLENRPEILDTFVRERSNPPARFEQYTEPGGENYREILIKQKEPPKPPPEYVYKVTGAYPGTFATRQEANDYVIRLNRMRQTARDDPSMAEIAESLARYPIQILTERKPVPRNEDEGYFHEHYPGQKNVIASPRLIDRYDTEGNRILNAEELQSDMAQAGRDEGFKPKKNVEEEKRLKDNVVNTSKEWQQAKKEFNELYDQIQQEKIRQAYKDALTPYDLPNALKEHEKWMKSADVDRVYQSYRQSFLTRGNSQLLPNLGEDFVNKLQDAHDNVVGAREAHDLAVRNRDDYVYSSNKGIAPAPYVTATKDWVDLVLKRLLKEAVDGGYKKFVWTPAEQQFSRWGSEMVRWQKAPGDDGAWIVDARGFVRPGHLNKLGDLNPSLDDVITSKDELYNTIEYAVGDKKKAAAMADKAWAKMQKEDSGSILPRKEGMEGFYGNKEHTSGVPPMVYARMKALLSKIDPDTKVGPHEVITHAEGDVDMSGFDLKYPDKLNTTTMPGVEITPKMIEAVRKGLPERARGGSIVSKALMLKSPSGSSLHEAMRIAKQHRGTPRKS